MPRSTPTRAAALRAALAMDPGQDRDARLAAALAEDGELLADEPYADWALGPRERLEALRQEARLALARDRAKGASDAKPEAVLAAWAACAEHDPASEEAAAALVRATSPRGSRSSPCAPTSAAGPPSAARAAHLPVARAGVRHGRPRGRAAPRTRTRRARNSGR